MGEDWKPGEPGASLALTSSWNYLSGRAEQWKLVGLGQITRAWSAR